LSEVKIFKVKGRITKPNYRSEFSKEIRAVTPEGATEKVYAEFGSHHRVIRAHVRIDSVQEISPEQSTDFVVRQLSGV
jgi:large subunit ribosomal protein LX